MSNQRIKKQTFLELMKEYKKYFVIYFVVFFALIFTVTYLLGMVPIELQVGRKADKIDSSFAVSDFGYGQALSDVTTFGPKPTRVVIEKIGVDSIIQQPTSYDVAVLDKELQKGAVYYPGSGTLSKGNIFLFGHSTNHQVVINQAYKTFNRLNELTPGDRIVLVGDDEKKYTYEVLTIDTVDDDKALVKFNTEAQLLTLSTCNTFGEKQQRHIVTAQQIDVK